MVNRFDVWLIQLDPTIGSEIRKTRPCVVVSPDEMAALSTVIVAPMTTGSFPLPSRVEMTFQGKQGRVLLDQLRTVDKKRLVKKLGTLHPDTSRQVCHLLTAMFAC